MVAARNALVSGSFLAGIITAFESREASVERGTVSFMPGAMRC